MAAHGSGGPNPWRARLAPLVPLVIFVLYLREIPAILGGNALVFRADWAASLGVSLTFRMDGLGLLFALLISGMGFLITAYANVYLAGDPRLPRFQAFLLLFMGSMLGVTTADNAILLFVFWELTSISSFLLIGFDHENLESRDAALKALLVTSGGGLVMLAGLLMMGMAAGTFEISEMGALGDHPLYLAILITIALGCFTKSAQVPFHFWLPAAMAAPTPVSAYLHSATMVKAGIYLLARLSPNLGGTEEWMLILVSAGALTMLTGSVLAIHATDLKKILAYTTVSALGMLVLLLGLDTPEAAAAAVLLLLAHVIYKGAFFLLAGTIDHDAGSREVGELGGLRHGMPLAAASAAILALGLAGFGPVLAFIAKEMLLESVVAAEWVALLIPAVIVSSGLLTAVAILLGWGLFWRPSPAGRPSREIRETHGLVAAPLFLALLSVTFALIPGWPSVLVNPAISAITRAPSELKLYLWHGVGTPLLLSIASVLLGVVVYAARGRWKIGPRADRFFTFGPDRWYGQSLAALLRGSERITIILQSGYIRSYITIILVTVISLSGAALVRSALTPMMRDFGQIHLHEAAVATLIVLAAFAAIRSESRLGAIASLGVVGYGIALLYIIFSGADLAMTQFLVETLMVILFVLVLYHLPRFSKISTRRARIGDAAVSISLGVLMALFVLVASNEYVQRDAARFFAENSYTAAYGRNIVNVILVDFRALDTAGEITVLAIAAVGVFALLKLRPEEGSR
jgi:multicomponent Na+:H+ antiporter subunit A